MIDTHAHLIDKAFVKDLGEVLQRAIDAGVQAVVAVGETLADAEGNLRLAERFPGFVHPAAGLFPTVLDEEAARELDSWMRRHGDKWIAVGEVGLDYWKVQDEEGRAVQERIFRRFVDLAIELDIPVNVHSRAAGRPAIEKLRQWEAQKVHLHAFDGRAAKAAAGVEAGYYFSIPPSIVRSTQKQKLVRQVPLENLLLETDSPVLGPDREKRNEPANVTVSLTAIAAIKDLAVNYVRDALRDNTERLYGSRVLEER